MEALMSTPAPLSFADLGVPEELLVALKERGIDSPFPVQALTIPDGLASGSYKVELILSDEDGKELDRKNGGFTVSGS